MEVVTLVVVMIRYCCFQRCCKLLLLLKEDKAKKGEIMHRDRHSTYVKETRKAAAWFISQRIHFRMFTVKETRQSF